MPRYSALKIHALIFISFAFCNMSSSQPGKANNEVNFSKTSIISQGFLHIYPGTNKFLNALYARPDTLRIFENHHVVILVNGANLDAQQSVMDYNSRTKYLLDKQADSIYVLHDWMSTNSTTCQAKGNAILNKLITGAFFNIPKLTSRNQKLLYEGKTCLVLTGYEEDSVRPGKNDSDLNIDSLRLTFDPKIKSAKYSLAPYYDSLGHGKVSRVDFFVKPFFSRIYNKKFEGFTFFNQLEYSDEVSDSSDIGLIAAVLSRVEDFKASRGKPNR